MKNKEKIDFVIMWVDGSDPKWLKEKNKYSEKKINIDDAVNRYRDMETLKYIFRGIETCTPWVNNVFFITWGHIPDWLDITNPKLKIVKHEDFIPKEYLPTFSSHTIELNLHRIKELSEKFVLFNDDFFILNPLDKEYFFVDGLPCDHWKENPYKFEDLFFDHIILNNLCVINNNFDKKSVLSKNFFKVFNLKYGRRNMRYFMLKKWNYFTGFECPHTANPYLKKSFKEVWEAEPKLLHQTCLHKFRSSLDVNQWLINWWQVCNGNFSVKNHNEFGRYYAIGDDNTNLINYMKSAKSTIVCINDTNADLDFEEKIKEIVNTFEDKFPEKSSFEK